MTVMNAETKTKEQTTRLYGRQCIVWIKSRRLKWADNRGHRFSSASNITTKPPTKVPLSMN